MGTQNNLTFSLIKTVSDASAANVEYIFITKSHIIVENIINLW